MPTNDFQLATPPNSGCAEQSLRQKVGILGGAFNPPHVGHLALGLAAVRELSLDRLLFVPSGTPPHKRITGGLTFDERSLLISAASCIISPEKLRSAFAPYVSNIPEKEVESYLAEYDSFYTEHHNPVFEICEIEKELPVPTYTFDMVTSLGVKNPQWDMFLIIGMDQAIVFDSWYKSDELSRVAQICAAQRSGSDSARVRSNYPFIRIFPFVPVDVSSTDIRAQYQESASSEMIPFPARNLYRILVNYHLR